MDAAAVAALGDWTPADDLALKNAIEAGASLESLAKGAVHFSRRFTVQELQDRWHSILYDPVVSEEASARMTEIECSTPTSASKFNRSGNSKENKCVPEKRKTESVRSCYDALRKRIRTEPFDPMGLNFILAPGDGNYVVNGDEPLSEHVMTVNPISNPFGLEGSDMDTTHHVFPHSLMDGSTAIGSIVTADTFQAEGFEKSVEEDFLVEQNHLHEEISHIEDNLPIAGNKTEVKEFIQPKELPDFIVGDLGMELPCLLDQINNHEGNVCSSFEGNQVISASISGSSASLENLEYSTQLPGTHIRGTVPAPAMPVDVVIRENDTCPGDALETSDDTGAKNTTTSGRDVDLGMEVKISEFKCLASTEVYLAELSNSLLNFTTEEELMFEDDFDKSYYDGLSSLLMSSPKDDVSEENVFNIPHPETPVIHPTNPSSTDPGVPYDIWGPTNGDVHIPGHLDMLRQSSSMAFNSQFPEYNKDGVICCVLNTEQWEIPCNDDVFLPNRLPLSSAFSKAPQNLQEANKPKPNCSSVKDLAVNQRKGDKMQKEPKNPLQNFKMLSDDTEDEDFTSPGYASGCLGQIDSAKASTNSLPEMLKEDDLTKSHMEKPHLGYDRFKSYPHTLASETKREHDSSAAITNNQSLHAEVMPMHNAVPEKELNEMTSDFEGLFDSDDDVPCYSDIEAMILDRDLDSDDQEMYSSELVSKYQDEDTKRAIMRLEQGAYAHLQRAIASHGAFAILYGRRSQHYIKKPEVLLGRATEDFFVDIDLAREGRGNKVSRQQALIKMEKDGSFYLKNLGSCLISVNSKELATGQSLTLSSSCLIEIRGMPFIFETNQTRVKQYLDSISQV